MAEDNCARRTLCDLDENISPQVKINIEIVNQFIQKLEKVMNSMSFNPPLRGFSIMHGGSAYESLAVKEKVDFDIIVVLGKPFVSENFIIERDDSTNFFTLKWNYPISSRRYIDKGGFLKAQRLQNFLFKKLQFYMGTFRSHDARILCREGLASLDVEIRCSDGKKISIHKGEFLKAQRLQNFLFKKLQFYIGKVRLHDAQILCREGLASLDVEIRCSDGKKISIDLAPQIACHSWGQCPDLIPFGQLPKSLRQHIDTLNQNASPVMFFSPCVPTRHQKNRNAHRLCNVAFSQLEKKFLISNIETRDMVRLVKFVAEKLEWKTTYGLKSFFVKRVAIKYSDELEKLTLWNGYKKLLEYIHQELNTGTIDGYFVRDQETYRQRPEKIEEFQKKIAGVLRTNATQIQSL